MVRLALGYSVDTLVTTCHLGEKPCPGFNFNHVQLLRLIWGGFITKGNYTVNELAVYLLSCLIVLNLVM